MSENIDGMLKVKLTINKLQIFENHLYGYSRFPGPRL